MVFDKTGTLTEEGLSLLGYNSVTKKFSTIKFDHLITQVSMRTERFLSEDAHDSLTRKFIECMATCHSVSQLDEMLVGDPLDILMF
jgi:cation-transporting P-type ATPase 13A2